MDGGHDHAVIDEERDLIQYINILFIIDIWNGLDEENYGLD